MSQIKQKGFSLRIKKRLATSDNKNLRRLSVEDLTELFSLFWDELSVCLRQGHRVIFDGWISFFTNPVKRKCYDTPNADSIKAGDRRASKWSYKYRIRHRPLPKFRKQAERELTEEQYIEVQPKKNKK